MVFIEDDAIEIASESEITNNFEKKHPECVWTVEKMGSKATKTWIQSHSKADLVNKGKNLPKNLWNVELEALQ